MSKPDNNTQASLRYLLDSRLHGNDEVGFTLSCLGVIPAQAGIQEMSLNATIARSGGPEQRKGVYNCRRQAKALSHGLKLMTLTEH